MRDFLRACWAEALKLKRTLALWLALATPLLMVLLQAMYVLRVRRLRGDLWQNLQQGVMGWAILMLPLTAALQAALLTGVEHRQNSWKQIFALPVSRSAVYAAKFAAANLLLGLSHVVLWCAMISTGLLLQVVLPALEAGPTPWLPLQRRLALTWLASGALIGIQLWVSARAKSFTVPLGLGISGVVVSVIAARDSAMTFWPWMFPANVAAADRVAPALLLGVVGGLIITALGAWDTARRDVL